MEKVTTAKRLQYIMNSRNLKQVDILEKCEKYCKLYGEKINKSHISQWVNGSNEPNQRKIVVLAKALGVQEAWLMGYDVPMEKTTAVPSFEPDHIKLISLYSKLTEEQKKTVMNLLESMVN